MNHPANSNNLVPFYTKTRYAPTPSGYLHLGNILSFVKTMALARKANAQILLRIDDMDRERTNKVYIQDIFDSLNFLGLEWHEGPANINEFESNYSQVHRMQLYSNALNMLREQNDVYACSCSRAQVISGSPDGVYPGTCRTLGVDMDRHDVSWRLDTNATSDLNIKTLSGRKRLKFPHSMHDFIVRKKDGFPAYQLVSLIDDVYFGVDLVVRGEDLLPSTIAQNFLAQKLGKTSFSDITFHHHSLAVDKTGKKLSKSEGATSVYHLRKQGKSARDILGMLAVIAGINQMPGSIDELMQLIEVNE